MGKKIKAKRDDELISWAVMASFVVLTVQYFVLVSLAIVGTPTGSLVQLASKLVVGSFFLLALPRVVRRGKSRFIVSFFVAAFLFSLHYALFWANQPYLQSLFLDIFLMCIPAFTYSMAIRDFEVLKKTMKSAGNIVMFFGTLTAIYAFSGRASIGSYSMSLSYYMLLPTLVHLDRLIEKFSVTELVLTVVSFLVILALGSRGAILCIVVFFALKILKPATKANPMRFVSYLTLLPLVGFTLIFYYDLLLKLDTMFLAFGINSRTIRLLMQPNLHLSGRDGLYHNVWVELAESPILGIGLAGDYRILDGSYVHNFFIEVLGNFGIIFGFMLIALVLFMLIRTLMRSDSSIYSLAILYVGVGFVPLMVSGSYLQNVKFWIFLGLLVNWNFLRSENGIAVERHQRAVEELDLS